MHPHIEKGSNFRHLMRPSLLNTLSKQSRVGRWKDAVTANIRAYEADMAFTDNCMVAYGPEHNTDMLIYAANMAGLVRARSTQFNIKRMACQLPPQKETFFQRVGTVMHPPDHLACASSDSADMYHQSAAWLQAVAFLTSSVPHASALVTTLCMPCCAGLRG
jgi:hypothetical protein